MPLSITADRFVDEVTAGAYAVDIRGQQTRDTDGIVVGALAIEPADVLDRLTPGSGHALAAAAPATRWILVSDDGHDAEWLAWHLQARGLTGVRFVVGGQRALRRSAMPDHVRRVLATVAEH
ncbi:hypothetical protein [Jongsikchunia kroppenstedtii]|uniref:hypothetical protein n=1 Tax=Jongsikchunia kroppenstedtii TaxID=1121721 RepID=UPI000399D11F